MLLEPLVSNLTILDKNFTLRKLTPNWAQREFLQAAEQQMRDMGRIRIIVLKARQLGISTIAEAILFSLCFAFEDYRAMAIAHEVPASQNLLAMAQRYWDNYTFKRLYTTKYAGKNHLAWTETRSSIHVATAGNKAVGRSSTVSGCHASEVAFWPDPEIAMLGLRQTIPQSFGTALILESTANGMGNYFHTMWEEAEAGQSEFKPLFFPWHRHPEYKASVIGLPYNALGRLDEDERALQLMGVSDDRLGWRRWAIKNLALNDIMKFRQEYPSTPAEAFVSSGTNVFPLVALNAVYEPEAGIKGQLVTDARSVTFQPRDDGPLTIYRRPHPDPNVGSYLVAGDPTRTTQGDFACAQVINRRTFEQVAEWRGRVDPVTFADVLFDLASFYNTALLSTEIEGPGYSTIGALMAKNYPRLYLRQRPDTISLQSNQYGWSTTMQTKHQMIGWMLRAIIEGSARFHSAQLFKESRIYVTLPGGGYGPADVKFHDDTVMAMAQAITCNVTEAPPVSAPLILPESASMAFPQQDFTEQSILAKIPTPANPKFIPGPSIPPADPPWADWPEPIPPEL